MNLRLLSKHLTDSMVALASDERLVRLLLNSGDTPLTDNLPDGFIHNVKDNTRKFQKIATQSSTFCRIFPTPFSLDIQLEEGAFLRLYYQKGTFDNAEVVMDTYLNVDIIVAKRLWLIKDAQTGESVIRPYEIMDRVIELIGKDAIHRGYRWKFTDFQHLAINDKFDAIRLYGESFQVN